MSHRTPKERRDRERREKLAAHRGLATWGERLVPLGSFRAATEQAGRALSPAARAEAVASYL
ncbi:MAG: hypothetical protein OEP45_03230, partial [Acidobacteriota bacterium]|nr:hypothetical protein [Acidobacteriota bacterium]